MFIQTTALSCEVKRMTQNKKHFMKTFYLQFHCKTRDTLVATNAEMLLFQVISYCLLYWFISFLYWCILMITEAAASNIIFNVIYNHLKIIIVSLEWDLYISRENRSSSTIGYVGPPYFYSSAKQTATKIKLLASEIFFLLFKSRCEA